MSHRISLVLGALTGAAIVARERKMQRLTERFGAAALETLLNAIEANDEETGMHVRRVAVYAVMIAEFAGFDESLRRSIERVGLFHDIGKIYGALFDIVHDAHRLSAPERAAMRSHPVRGADVLRPLEAFYPDLPVAVAAHHEWWDGSGYPRGLRGNRIPIEARVVAIADTFDAVSHTRRYHRGSGPAAALRVVSAARGTQFDPELVDLVMLPPVAARLADEHVLQHARVKRGRRHAMERERIPDISFRWRSESLRSRRVSTARDSD